MRPSSNTKGRKTPLLANQAATSYKTVDYIKKYYLGMDFLVLQVKLAYSPQGAIRG